VAQAKAARRPQSSSGPASDVAAEVGDGRRRVVIEAVWPEIDGGRFPAKATPGEPVVVEADVYADGHDHVACVLLHRHEDETGWREEPMESLDNDRWRGRFQVPRLGRHRFTIEAWVDHFDTWAADLEKRVEAGQDVAVDLELGARMVDAAAGRAAASNGRAADAGALKESAGALRTAGDAAVGTALSGQLRRLMAIHADRRFATTYARELAVQVERDLARFGAWYEMFPRSTSPIPGRHGTFRDVEKWLSYVAGMGFDVLYLPPIHPIGRVHRKGANNVVNARPEDPGSPWAIGSAEGGHTSIHPELGEIEDLRRLAAAARRAGLELALDIAFQCAPDHPYASAHPEWFRVRPDGTIQYAENPPKKYQDIYPFDFETDAWAELWHELREVVRHWCAQGIRIFRVDNPHTKPFGFWEWLLETVRREHPDTIFLSEAFTRPKVMHRLAKIGFSQSYTYFAWRQQKWELAEYFTELSSQPAVDYMRPNLWPNTPDILTEQLQSGSRGTFFSRLVLAATLGASYGIYGPAFELCEQRALVPGREEYLDSEKYQLRHWDLDDPNSLRAAIARVNQIRRDNPALQTNRSLRFHHIGNDELICYSKTSSDPQNTIIVVVNLSARTVHSGWTHLDLAPLGLVADQRFEVEDLLTGSRYDWRGSANFVQLDPLAVPAHVLKLNSI
jgi:starch synthase (maltosyl-transferring)